MTEYKPSRTDLIDLHAVRHCTNKCRWCCTSARFYGPKEFEAESYLPWLEELRRRNVRWDELHVVGGEPFLHSDLAGFVGALKGEWMVSLSTNGFWLAGETEKWDGVMDGLGKLTLSLYPKLERAVPDYKERLDGIARRHPGMKVEVLKLPRFIKWGFSGRSEEPTNRCNGLHCPQLGTDGLLSRCWGQLARGANPNVTPEFEAACDETMFYDLRVDDGRDFKAWREMQTLSACRFCTAWKWEWADWDEVDVPGF